VSDQPVLLQVEIPPEVMQQEVWNLETQLGSLPGVTTDLQEPKDLLAMTLQRVEKEAIEFVKPFAQAIPNIQTVKRR